MLFRNKLLILTVLIPLIMISSSNQGLTVNNFTHSSIKSKQALDPLSGNVTIIIYNIQAFYTSANLNQITSYVNNILSLEYPNCNFNITIIANQPDGFVFKTVYDQIVNQTHPEYLIIMGGIQNGQSIFSNIKDWMLGTKYTNIKQIALIDNMISKNNIFNNPNNQIGIRFTTDNVIVHNLSLANIDFSQAGFMSGVQSSLLTKTHKIGLILDHTLQVDFTNKINSPYDQNGYPIYSFDRDNFVMGFIAGVEYGSEYLLKSTKIDIQTEVSGFNNSDLMNKNVQTLADFGADVIFNMESGLDNNFIQDAASHSIKTGVLGSYDSSASFSFIENNSVIISNLLQTWNKSSTGVNWTYNLGNSSVMGLSVKTDSRLSDIKTEILNGTIQIPNYISEGKVQGIPGFELVFVFVTLVVLVSKKKIKKI